MELNWVVNESGNLRDRGDCFELMIRIEARNRAVLYPVRSASREEPKM